MNKYFRFAMFAIATVVIAIVLKYIVSIAVMQSINAIKIYGDMNESISIVNNDDQSKNQQHIEHEPGYTVDYTIFGEENALITFIDTNSLKTVYRKLNNHFHYEFTAYTKNHPMKFIRLKPNAFSYFSIHQINFYTFFGTVAGFNASALESSELLLNDVERINASGESINFKVTGPNPSITITQKIVISNPWLMYVLPWIMAILIAYFIFYNISWAAIPAIRDVVPDEIPGKINYQQLNGFRGLAALYVIFEHTHPAGIGLGHLGVLMFFSLSGFLLSIPFVYKPQNILSLSYVGNYFSRRLRRIVPLYFVIVTVTMLFKNEIFLAFRHYFFLQGDGYLWTIQQEMVFYLLLPAILLMNYFLSKNVFLVVVTLMLAAFFANAYLSTEVAYLYGLGIKKKLYISVFLLGVALAYFYHKVYLESMKMQLWVTKYAKLLSIISMLIFCLTVYYARRDALPNYNGLIVGRFDFYFALLNGVLMFSILALPKSVLGRLFASKFLVALGITGYSLYLIHPEIIDFLKGFWHLFFGLPLSSPVKFVFTLLITYVMSIFTYSYIEKPFISVKSKPAYNK